MLEQPRFAVTDPQREVVGRHAWVRIVTRTEEEGLVVSHLPSWLRKSRPARRFRCGDTSLAALRSAAEICAVLSQTGDRFESAPVETSPVGLASRSAAVAQATAAWVANVPGGGAERGRD